MKKVLFIFFLFYSFCTGNSYSKELVQDSIQISLLTCSPGSEIYSLFGHSALRVIIPHKGIDKVYNYGLFDFNSKNFIWRFALGQTDYNLGKVNFEHFMFEYTITGRSVWEQIINLSFSEKQKLIQLLEQNNLPEYRTYRYNFLYDNCATRPLEMINKATSRIVKLNDYETGTTSFRKLMHRYAQNDAWGKFGIDLCLGSSIDQTITVKQKTFIPIELMNILKRSTVEGEPILLQTHCILEGDDNINQSSPTALTPLTVFTVLFIILLLISIYEYRKQKTYWPIDLLLFSLFGVVGTVILFLVFISEHPGVSPNYLLLVFHPLHLIFAPYIGYKEKKIQKIKYHYLNLIVLTLFVIFFKVIPQYFDLAILPLAGILLVRSISYIFTQTKK